MQENAGQQFLPWIGVGGGQGLREGASCVYSLASDVKLFWMFPAVLPILII